MELQLRSSLNRISLLLISSSYCIVLMRLGWPGSISYSLQFNRLYTFFLKCFSGQSKSVANCGILLEFGAFIDTIHCKIRSLKHWLRVTQCEQTKLRAICYNYQSRNVDKAIDQGSSTRGPRAACVPWASFVRPGKGISQSTMRYEYWSLSH